MISIKFENKEAMIRFPEELISAETVQNFIEQLRVDTITQKSKLTEKQVWEMTEQIQKEWWDKNKNLK